MTTVTYATAAGSDIRPWNGTIQSAVPTRVIWSDSSYESTFRGIGFTYREGKIISGVFTDFVLKIGSADYLTIDKITLSGPQLQAFWDSGNFASFWQGVFAGNDSITGSSGADYLAGYGGGRDTIFGGLGDDTIIGGADNDSLVGSNGNDVIYSGGGGLNTISGGNGDDIIYAGGFDVVAGNGGSDAYILSSGTVRITESLTSGGIDEVTTQFSYKLPNGVENLTLTGTTNASGTGSDRANRIIGNDGENVIDGGLGIDTLAGGLGKDVFLFSTTPNATTNVDQIIDYVATGNEADRIAFDRTVYVGFKYFGNLSPAQFLDTAGTGEVTSATRVLYDSQTGELSYDRDGAGTLVNGTLTNVYSPVLVAVIQDFDGNPPALNFRDFFVVA